MLELATHTLNVLFHSLFQYDLENETGSNAEAFLSTQVHSHSFSPFSLIILPHGPL